MQAPRRYSGVSRKDTESLENQLKARSHAHSSTLSPIASRCRSYSRPPPSVRLGKPVRNTPCLELMILGLILAAMLLNRFPSDLGDALGAVTIQATFALSWTVLLTCE